MKKKKLLIIALLLFVLFTYKNVYAFDSSNYRNRELCDANEVAGFHEDGYIDTVACFAKYEDAKDFMVKNGAKDLAIMTKVNGQTKIVDANYGILDLSVNPETLTYFYTDKENSWSYTYMDTGSLYGGVDGAQIDAGWSSRYGWMAKVKTGNFTGWIKASTYEIVPITWIKSISSYTVSDTEIRHNYVAKIQNYYNGSKGSTIGPKPEMLNKGTYYSYDGHYFYTDVETMIRDYKNGNYNNSVNKDNVYYNYYMYLSNHTKTAYSSINIDEYIRNNLGYYKGVYGNEAEPGTSRLYGQGTFFYYAQEKYGVNAILALSLSRNETANGRSYLAVNKNNGFGLDAVDSDPINGARWYPTFASSILGYASKWVTYGYAHPRDWRYFGPQFGDKWIGMNVKYASDTYWSEKMASNYYYLDKSLGLQDYNYYQLGVVNGPTIAYQNPNTSSRQIYTYPEKEDAVVIVDEVTQNNEKWYKVVSDLNIDSNYNEITSGDYNWNAYVYVKASQVTKINNGKNGYVSPNSVFEYSDKNYEYDLHIENGNLKPQVGIATKNTTYYFDSTLSSRTSMTLLKDRYVMVYATALEENTPVAYLVTSDYNYDQKHWVKAEDIKLTDTTYAKVTLNIEENTAAWINYNTDQSPSTLISGLYTNSYIPILEQAKVGYDTWYKVPVNLIGNNDVYGYILATDPLVTITTSKGVVTNAKPTITASDKEIDENATFNPKDNVTAKDQEDGDLTSKIEITENTVNTKVPGVYKVTYKVADSVNQTTTKTIKVTVIGNNAPVINATDKTLNVNDTFNPKDNVTATDTEDGDLTSSIEVITNTVDTTTKGTYKVVYKVTDSKGKSTTKEISVVVKEEVLETTTLEGINLTALNISGTNFKQKESIYYFDYLKENNSKLEIKGYNVIKGIDNNLNKNIYYVLKLVSLNNNEVYAQTLSRVTDKNEITRPVNSQDTQDYTYSWFKGNIELKNIPDGDYKMYIISISEDSYYSTSLISNKVLRTQTSSYHGDKYVTTRNNYYDNSIPLELIVRSEKIGDKTAKSTYNLYNQYRVLEFTNNNLHIKGTSYSYGMDLGKNTNVERKIIFENTNSYEKYTFDLGSTDQGLYQAGTNLGDNQAKDKAWFDANIDLSSLPKGNYAIYISTTSNVSDYGEFTEALGRDVSKVTTVINNKTYKFNLAKDKRYRLELIVE
jgi:beta-N-acetylglucosaminidase